MTLPTHRPLVTIAESLVDLARELSRQATRDLTSSAQHDAGQRAVSTPRDPRSAAVLQLAQRRLRKAYLPAPLFHEPGWEVLLGLYTHDNGSHAMSLKELSLLVDAPFTTTQRWVDQMVRLNLITRVEAADDRRRVELSLSAACREGLDAYFDAIARAA